MTTNRREFLKTGAGLALAAAARQAPAQLTKRPPNLLFLHVDQLHADIISGYGCRHVQTPNIDRLAAGGLSFRNAYIQNSVCCPSRSCWYTGRAACEHGVVINEWPLREDIPDLGQWFSGRGWAAVYVGKWHIPNRKLADSFRVLHPGAGVGEHGDAWVSRAGQAFLHEYRGDQPFFLNLGFLQPHDCCYWVFEQFGRQETLPYPHLAAEYPDLPANHAWTEETEPALIRQRRGQSSPCKTWTPDQWRYYLWAYSRMVEMVDTEIGRVLDALDDSGHANDTMVIFQSDHGDGLGRHGMVSKMFLYDEAARVPTIIRWPGEVPAGATDHHLVGSLDVPATLCDYAGLEPMPKARGRSLRPILTGQPVEWRDTLCIEAQRTGRAVRTPEWKLIRYEADDTVQLFDMNHDPGETANLATTDRGAEVVKQLTGELRRWEATLEPLDLTGRNPKAKGR